VDGGSEVDVLVMGWEMVSSRRERHCALVWAEEERTERRNGSVIRSEIVMMADGGCVEGGGKARHGRLRSRKLCQETEGSNARTRHRWWNRREARSASINAYFHKSIYNVFITFVGDGVCTKLKQVHDMQSTSQWKELPFGMAFMEMSTPTNQCRRLTAIGTSTAMQFCSLIPSVRILRISSFPSLELFKYCKTVVPSSLSLEMVIMTAAAAPQPSSYADFVKQTYDRRYKWLVAFLRQQYKARYFDPTELLSPSTSWTVSGVSWRAHHPSLSTPTIPWIVASLPR